MSNYKQIEKPLEPKHQETIVSYNTTLLGTHELFSVSLPTSKKIVGWYCLNSNTRRNCTAFATYNKPNFIKRFFMRTLLDFHWVKEVDEHYLTINNHGK